MARTNKVAGIDITTESRNSLNESEETTRDRKRKTASDAEPDGGKAKEAKRANESCEQQPVVGLVCDKSSSDDVSMMSTTGVPSCTAAEVIVQKYSFKSMKQVHRSR